MKKQDILEQNHHPDNKDSHSLFFKSELKNMSLHQLKNTHKELNYLCLELDPYNLDFISIELENILNKFQLTSTLSNPFTFTNIILQMLNQVEEELNTRIQ